MVHSRIRETANCHIAIPNYLHLENSSALCQRIKLVVNSLQQGKDGTRFSSGTPGSKSRNVRKPTGSGDEECRRCEQHRLQKSPSTVISNRKIISYMIVVSGKRSAIGLLLSLGPPFSAPSFAELFSLDWTSNR